MSESFVNAGEEIKAEQINEVHDLASAANLAASTAASDLIYTKTTVEQQGMTLTDLNNAAVRNASFSPVMVDDHIEWQMNLMTGGDTVEVNLQGFVDDIIRLTKESIEADQNGGA